MLKYIALMLTFVAAPLATAQADNLAKGHAKNFVLANSNATVYYTVKGEAYEVVTTLAPDGFDGSHPMRFVSHLSDGESHVVSIGGYGNNTTLTTMRVSRAGKDVSVDVDTDQVSWARDESTALTN